MLKSRSTPSASQPSNPGRKTAQAWRAARFLIAPSLLVATFAFSCSDDDQTDLGPTGGSGGNGASGGSAGAGGSGGNGGSSVAGAAGMGGSAGSGAGAGGSAGTGNMAGSAGTGGAVNDPDAGDGGPDADTDSGSSPPPIVTQQDAANAICALQDAVANCDPPPNTCPDDTIGGWEFFKGLYPNCVSKIDAYFFCIANEPVSSYDCSGGTTTPEVTSPQTGNCADEDTAFQGVQAETDPCTQP